MGQMTDEQLLGLHYARAILACASAPSDDAKRAHDVISNLLRPYNDRLELLNRHPVKP